MLSLPGGPGKELPPKGNAGRRHSSIDGLDQARGLGGRVSHLELCQAR